MIRGASRHGGAGGDVQHCWNKMRGTLVLVSLSEGTIV